MKDKLLQRYNESFLSYAKRITNNRKEYDLDYSEWAKLLIDKEYSSDNARKSFYILEPFLNKLEETQINNIDDSDLINEIEQRRLELEKERKKLQATKVEYNRNIRTDSKQELLYENIKDTKDRLPMPDFKPIPMNNDNMGEYLLCWSDLHYGAEFVSENNIYSREECKNRLEKLTYKVKEKCLDKDILRLNVTGLGDDIQGLLRVTDVKINDISVMECVVEVSRLIANVLNSLSEVAYIKYYHTMASNHTQTRPITGKADLIKEDLEFIIGNYIKDLLSNNPRIEVILSDKDYHSITLASQNILMMHGHQVRNIQNIIADYSLLHRKIYDLCFIGHFHGGKQLSVGEVNGNTSIIVVPSVVGSDPYSDSLKVGSKSMAKLYKIEENCGITEEYTFVLN